MEAYPLMVRRRIIELTEQQKLPTRQIASIFGICKSGVRRVKQVYRELGTLRRPRHGKPGRKPTLTAELEQRLREHVAAQPDATRQEIKDALSLEVSLQTLSDWLIKLGLRLKKSRRMPPSRIGRT